MKWFYAGLALVIASLVGGMAAMVAGYRQVIGRYVAQQTGRTASKQAR